MVDDDVKLIASINENNIQGAVLWGVRSNSSVNGIVTFSHLVISKEGFVDFKISQPVNSDTLEKMKSKKIGSNYQTGYETLYITKMIVAENPEMKQTDMCLFVFYEAICPNYKSLVDINEWTSTFPSESGIVSVSRYMDSLSCMNLWDTWYVKSNILPTGETIIEYRGGIASIWTGNDLPREEMSPYDRLGISPTCTNAKEIRRAYYKKSLQWHPDRWVGMELYKLPVQGAFELVAEAYRMLTEDTTSDGSKD
jgi:hypothetical protein